jgi:membrane-associated phospholipid phosphatase
MRDWGPVLAAFALCPLLALLGPTDPADPLARAVAVGDRAATRAAEGGQRVYALQSPFAAMPSGHVAFAVFAAGTLVALVRCWTIRLAAVAYGALVVGVVISTGNHFWLDVAAGSAIATVAMRATA